MNVGHRVQIGALILLDLLCLWIASSALRKAGLLTFAFGLAALGLALRGLRRGDRRGLLFVSFFAVLAAAPIVGVESALHIRPQLLEGRVANHTFGGYYTDRGGIYREDPHQGAVLLPNRRRSMYWNGHWWQHETNADGYRGPRLPRADAVFLGDSMIYGHGVETPQAVPAQFERVSGLATANLGQQGTCLVQASMRLEGFGARLHPRVVFVCSHPTDVRDAHFWYDEPELVRYLESDDYRPTVRMEYHPDRPRTILDVWMKYVALPLRTGRALVAVLKPPRDARSVAPIDTGRFVPPPDGDEPFDPGALDDPSGLGWRVHVQSLRRLKKQCDAIGARLVTFDLGYPRPFSRAVEAAALEMGIEYDPAGRKVVEQARAGAELYLRGDGHWNAEGAERIARELALREARHP